MAGTEISCSTCSTTFEVEVQRDERGGYAEVPEQKPCADQDCDTPLCLCCERRQCDGCSQWFCETHWPVDFSGERFCTVCMSEISETAAEAVAEYAETI